MKFEPGKSGNKNGRPKGSINKMSQLAKLLDPHADLLVAKVVEMALSGDSNAMRLCIERIIPRAREQATKIVVPDTKNKTINQALLEILHSLHGQEITISELKGIIALVHDDEQIANNNSLYIKELQQDIDELVKKYEREY